MAKKESAYAKYFLLYVLTQANEKYTGDVRLLKSGNRDVHYLASDNNPAIITKEVFEAVQTEKERRSNVVKDENGSRRKNKKYSSRK